MAGSGVLFRTVDRAVFAAALVDRLRDAGVAIGLSATNRFVECLRVGRPADVTSLYWVARTSLVSDRRDYATFDAVFDALFRDESLAVGAGRHNAARATVRSEGSLVHRSAPVDGFALMAGRASVGQAPEFLDPDPDAEDGSDDALEVPELLPSALTGRVDTPFDRLSADELALFGGWIQAHLADFPSRRGRRQRPSPSGGLIDVRRTIAEARRTAGEPVALARRRPRRRPRGVVVLADVSGSMESFTRVYLHLMRALVTHGQAEVFTFATELRRVTVALRDGDADTAIDRVSDEVADRFGGTRLGDSLGLLTASPVWSNSVRGAIVVIASDGWDAGDPLTCERNMARLARMAHRVIWVNPRVAAEEFAPLVGAMSAALPHIDVLLSGHTIRSLFAVLDAVIDS